jgi:hypothetical protein
MPRCPPQVPNIRSVVWKTIQLSKAKEVLSYNGMLEKKGVINLQKKKNKLERSGKDHPATFVKMK